MTLVFIDLFVSSALLLKIGATCIINTQLLSNYQSLS